MLAFFPRVRNLLGHVGRFGNSFATDIEDDVADLEAVISGNTVWIDPGNEYAVALVTGLFGRSQRQAKFRNLAVRGGPLVLLVGGLMLGWQSAEGKRHRFVLALMDQSKLDRDARNHGADPPGEFAGVRDRIAVDRGDNVAAGDACLGSRAIGLRLGH